MPKKLIYGTLTLLCWIALQPAYTQPSQSDSIYTMLLWRARLIVQDAVIKRIQDTTIITLERKLQVMESNSVTRESQFADLIKQRNAEIISQVQLTSYESSLKSYYKARARKFKRQRNIAVVAGIGAIATILVFKPP